MHDSSIPDDGLDGRVEARTNLFLAATMLAGGSTTAVKIRDLSPIGAQLESLIFPEVGSAMTLARGRLSVHGHVSWSTKHRCGLHFSTRVSVREWMTSPVSPEQQRVDNPAKIANAVAVPIAAPAYRQAAGVFAEDLARVVSLLETLGDALAGDPAIVAAHGVTLQNLDIALQTLTALAAIARADEPEHSASVRRLEELRISGAQALGPEI